MSFEILEHPADIGFHAEAVTLPQLFTESARALQFIIFEPPEIARHDNKIELNAEGSDYESLLVNWLNELVYYIDSQRLAFDYFDITSLDETRIQCEGFAAKRDPLKAPTKLIVKAVTYHQLRITQSDKVFTADVYVDV